MNTLVEICACVKRTGLLLTIAILGGACGAGGPSFTLLPDGQLFKQNSPVVNNKIDVLFVVDSSGSMSGEQALLASNFSAFITKFQTKNYDFKIAVTATDAFLANTALSGYNAINAPIAKFRDQAIDTADGTYAAIGGTPSTGVFVILPNTLNLATTFATNIKQGTVGTGDERAFSSFMTALNSPLNTGFLRSDSFLAVVVVSDEDDFSGYNRALGTNDHNYTASSLDTVASYASQLDALTGTSGVTRRYNVSDISALDTACAPTWLDTHLPNRMTQLSTLTNGVSGSICDANFNTSLELISSKISELSTQFYLDRVPVVETITIKVNGYDVPQSATNGWTYNAEGNSIVFHGDAVPAEGDTIEVNFVPVTIK